MTNVKAWDSPPSVSNYDDTILANVTTSAYFQGVPEVGVTFVAPTSGRVAITVGGGLRDNGSIASRIFLAPQVFTENSDGTEVLSPSVGPRGVSSLHEATDFMYISRTSLLTGLTAGNVYYARVMYSMSTQPVSPATPTADIASREIAVGPA